MAKEDGVPGDALEMSDEDFLDMDPSEFDGPPVDDTDDDDAGTDDSDSDDSDDDHGTDDDDDDDSTDDDDDDDASEDDDDADVDKTEEARRAALTEEERTIEDASDDTSKEEKPPKKSAVEIADAQYAEIGKQIMAEFKANGKTVKIKSAEDAIQLMQMGANYSKKMAGLKPSLKTLKLLENNGLLDPEKLNYLIDLSQKKPEAITQLLKDSKIDPMDIDLNSEETYVPNQRTISDTEIDLDSVLDAISTSPFYNETLNVLGEEWDTASRETIAKTPEIIRTINTHMENGIYEQVSNAVAYERNLGKLLGVSDFEAYQRVGSHMAENKLFKAPTGQKQSESNNHQNNQAPNAAEIAEQIRQRKDRKKAASPSRRKKAPVAEDKSKYNPLAMSDEEFIKLNNISL